MNAGFKKQTSPMTALMALNAFALIGCATGCAMRDPHFAIMGKSQNVLSSVTANNKVDILWVIDNSGTMGPKQQNLANSINSFMNQFITKQFDYRIAVVTTDIRPVDPNHPTDPNFSGQEACFVSGGSGIPTVITPSDASAATDLAANAQVGHFGIADAHSLDAARLALSAPNMAGGGCNEDFLRPDAFLSVIFFSDADDDTTATTSGLIAFLDSIKSPIDTPNGGQVRSYFTSGMVVDDLSRADCQALGPFSEVGAKFLSLAGMTGGVISSICAADFSSGLLAVGTKILEATTAIVLSQVPDTTTINILENGVPVPNDGANGWTFDAATNRIVFHGNAIPSASGVILTVNYTPADIVR